VGKEDPVELDFSIKMNVKWNDVEYVGENKFEIPQSSFLNSIFMKIQLILEV